MLAATMLAAAFTSCNEVDPFDGMAIDGKLDPTEAVESGSTVSTLSFMWDEVENAVEYGYVLCDTKDKVIAEGTTTQTTAQFSKLQPATTYVLKVYAFGASTGDKGTSPAYVLEATTAATNQLASPSGFQAASAEGITTVSWNEVENAYKYVYTLKLGEEEVATGRTSKTSVDFEGLKHLEYTIEVTALSKQEAYIDSYEGAFKFEVTATEIWTVDGEQTIKIIDDAFELTLTAYDDGQYKLESWFGVDGFDLVFKLGENNVIIPWGAYEENNGVYTVPTGESAVPEVYLSTSGNGVSVFDGSYGDGGSLLFNVTSYAGQNDPVFTWKAQVKALYTVKGIGHCSITGEDYNATLTIYNNRTGKISSWYGVEDYDLEFEYNPSNGYITGILNGENWGDGENNEGVLTGLDEIDPDTYEYYMYVYWAYKGTPGYSTFRGDDGEGKIYLTTNCDGWGNYTFTWGSDYPTFDSLFTDYTYTTEYYFYEDDDWVWYDWDGEWSLDRGEGFNEILLYDFVWEYYPVVGVYNRQEGTITIQPTQVGYYILAGTESVESPVVGRVSEDGNTITFDDYQCYYGSWIYLWYAKTVFTRK